MARIHHHLDRAAKQFLRREAGGRFFESGGQIGRRLLEIPDRALRNNASLLPNAAYRLGVLIPIASVSARPAKPSYPCRQKIKSAASSACSALNSLGRPLRIDRLFPIFLTMTTLYLLTEKFT